MLSHFSSRHGKLKTRSVLQSISKACFTLLSISLIALSFQAVDAAEDVVFEDFEGDDWGAWTVTGTAFGAGPADVADVVLANGSFSLLGEKMVDTRISSGEGTVGVGSIVSPAFTVTHDFIHFLMAGGGGTGQARIRLRDANTNSQLRIATGARNTVIALKIWDVSQYLGRSVKISIEDLQSTAQGYTIVDHIMFSNDAEIQLPGTLAAERWSSISAFDVKDLVMNQKFYATSDASELSSSSYTQMAKYSGARLRGYVTAPVSGNYTFWISASTSGQLWLSSEEEKYSKQLLAEIGGDTGSGSAGVFYTSSNRWDSYTSQMSQEVYLEAGEKYYMEMLSQQHHVANGKRHISVAWARPDQPREAIPAEFFTSYIPTSDDLDDDFLPDSWEVQYGLDPADNGLVDRAHQGERGDFDLDGLSNREEYVLGTDPSNADTDGDGLSDGDEVRSYSTNPTQSDAPSEALISDLDLSTYTSDGITWTMTSQGLIPSSFRGNISWQFSVPGDGYWSINAATTLLGDLYLQESVDFEISIDGTSIGKKTLAYGQGRDAILRILTPYLTAGTHTLGIKINNMIARRMVTFRSIQVLDPQGADLDGDGFPDWINSQLTGQNRLLPYPPLSRTSPASLEGYGSVLSHVLLNGNAVSSGVDSHHWFTDLDLQAEGATPFSIAYDSQLNETGAIQWQATNVMDVETLIIRQNDALKLTAHTASVPSSTLRLPQVEWTRSSGVLASQSTTAHGGSASRAIDGNTDGRYGFGSTTHTANVAGSWWQVDLGADRAISEVILWNRTDGNLGQRLASFRVSVLDAIGNIVTSKDYYTSSSHASTTEKWVLPSPVTGRKVKIQKIGSRYGTTLSLAEVQVFGSAGYITLNTNLDYTTYQFAEAGEKTVIATLADGTTGSLTVHVKKADFSPVTKDLLSNTVNLINLSPSAVSSDLYFEGGDAVFIDSRYDVTNTNIALQAKPIEYGRYNLIARLYQGGPILGTQPLNVMGFADVLQTGQQSTFFSRDFTGYMKITSPIVATDLPIGGKVIVRIFRAGVTFMDGTKTRTLTAEDFINDVYYLDFLFPVGLSGGYCHHVDIYDRNGSFVARR